MIEVPDTAPFSGLPFVRADIEQTSQVQPLADFVDPTMGCSDLVKGQPLHYRLPGWHDRMFHDEGAALIAEHLRPLLDRVETEARSAP
jgi:hypothetical protein